MAGPAEHVPGGETQAQALGCEGQLAPAGEAAVEADTGCAVFAAGLAHVVSFFERSFGAGDAVSFILNAGGIALTYSIDKLLIG